MKGHIRQRGKGSWSIIFDIGRDETGKRKQKWHTVKGTKRDAERELARLLTEYNTGSYVEPSRMTVADYLEQWLRDYAMANVAPKTYERYAGIVRKNLIPALGGCKLDKLQPVTIQSFYTKALSNGRTDGKGGLSRRTVLHCHRVLHEALHQAVKWQLLARNPADPVQPPRPVRKEIQVLTNEEIAILLEATQGTRYRMVVLLAFTTGMRRGEILALRWQDVNLDAGKLMVRQSLEQTANGLKFKEPKSQRGRRTVTLPEVTTDELRRLRASQAQERLLLGPQYRNNDLVCCRPDGGPWEPDAVSRGFAKLIKRCGTTRVRFHDLRHSHATQLLKEGVNPKVVSERLGHSTVGLTLDTYSHVLPDIQEEAARKVDNALRTALGNYQNR